MLSVYIVVSFILKLLFLRVYLATLVFQFPNTVFYKLLFATCLFSNIRLFIFLTQSFINFSLLCIYLVTLVFSSPNRASFHWKLNGSERTYLSHSAVSSANGHLISHYSFLGTSDKDYGRLLCWANNSIGVQQHACVFSIIPAGK